MHTIRLRGPWQLEPIVRFERQPDGTFRPHSSNLPVAARMTMPADWSKGFGADFLGRVRYHRVFQMPTGLDEGQRVWLVVGPPRSRGDVTLNDSPLGEVRYGEVAGRFEIQSLLEDHNRLVIVVEHPLLDASGFPKQDSDTKSPGGLIGEIRLEIEE